MVKPSDSAPPDGTDTEPDEAPTRVEAPTARRRGSGADPEVTADTVPSAEADATDERTPSATSAAAQTPSVVVDDPGVAGVTEERDPEPGTDPPGPGAQTTFASPVDLMRHDEIRRTRLLGVTGVALSGLVALALPFLEINQAMLPVVLVGMAVVIGTNLWLIYLCNDPRRYTTGKVGFIWVAAAFAISFGVLVFGVFSPAPMVLLLGIYFIGLGADFRIALLVYLACSVSVFVASLCFALDLYPDPGFVHASYRPAHERLIAVGLIQVVFLFSFLLARSSHRTTMRSVSEFNQAVRAIAQREALLQEARQDLERALQIGGAGRFTGQTLGSYRLGSVIGRGAMGEVYEASHKDSGDTAAVKLLQPAMLGNPSYVKRFMREVEVASALEVDHVVRVIEVSDPSAPFPYLAMELLQGEDLAQILRVRRKLEQEEVCDLVYQIGRGVHAAGQAGIVHRDLKPQNLFRHWPAGSAPTWKILDFGVSKLADHSGTLTQGNIVGTPVYMAPEQASGQDVDHRADLYALAAIAFRCLTGHLLFRGKDVPSILYRVVYEMPVRPSRLADVPGELDQVLSIALAKDPRNRFDSAEEFAAALAAALRGEIDDALRRRSRSLERDFPWRSD
jgi:eukaryotic-like serine/threonine-protein kinase